MGQLIKNQLNGGVNKTNNKQVSELNTFFNKIKEFKDFISPPTTSSPLPTLKQTEEEEEITLFPDIDNRNKIKNIWQGSEPWGPLLLGDGVSSVSNAGCLLTAITIIENFFKKRNKTPLQNNDIFKNANMFVENKSLLKTYDSIRYLKISVDENKKISNGQEPEMTERINETLTSGGLVIAHIDWDWDLPADHFIVIHSKIGSEFICADPGLR